jgi:putative tryptophan/tyrosine transport system substrate-binding protein
MKKILTVAAIAVAIMIVVYLMPKSSKNELRIGLVLPAQHVALDEIAQAFKDELSQNLKGQSIHFEVQNALGDLNLQKSAINKFIADKVDLLVSVGKGATQMALHNAPKEQPILFLAAFLPPDRPEVKQKPGLMGVIDEIPVSLQLKFMKLVVPDLKKMAVVYVSSDKIFDDVDELSKETSAMDISLQKLMVQNISELYTISSRIEPDNQAIFILKDVLVASGINALIQQADSLKIPLITSDEGTIKQGGAFAVGVTEVDIGRQGAQIAAAFFQKSAISEPIQYLKKISVFVNKEACQKGGINLSKLEQAAHSLNLSIIEI